MKANIKAAIFPEIIVVFLFLVVSPGNAQTPDMDAQRRRWREYMNDREKITPGYRLDAELRPAAERGNKKAQIDLADILRRFGDDLFRGQPPDSQSKWEKNANGQFQEIIIRNTEYKRKTDIPEYKEAANWYRRAVEKGSRDAAGRLLSMYQSNEIYMEPAEVLKVSRMSAQTGNSSAQGELCKRYQSGDGVPRNYMEAYFWCSLATARDPQYNRREQLRGSLDSLEQKMSPQQIAEAQKRAAAWKPQYDD